VPLRHSMEQLPWPALVPRRSKVLARVLGHSKVLERVQGRNKVLAQRHRTLLPCERRT